MKTTKRTLWKLLLICAAMFLSVGSTIAYLTDSDGDVNVMTLGRVEIDLIEQERVPGGYDVFHDDHPLIPGVYPKDAVTGSEDGFWPASVHNAVDKIVTVKNTGNSDAYVRLWFAFEVTGENDFFEDKIHLNKNAADWSWKFLDGTLTQDGAQYVVAVATYQEKLLKGETTPVSLRQVLLDSSATNGDVAALGEKYSILVVAQGVQASGFTSEEQALTSGFGEKTITNHPFKGMSENEPSFQVDEGSLRKALTQIPGVSGNDNRLSVSGVTFGRPSEYDLAVKNAAAVVPLQEEKTASGALPMLFTTAFAEESSEAAAYYVEDGNGKYHVYILTDGTIKLPKDCEELVGNFGNLKVFTASNLDASDVEHMKNMFKGCNNLSVVTVPDGVTIIPEDMFADCENLEVVEIPGTVEKINENAFNSKKDTVYLIVEKGSAAEEWGNNNNGFQTTNWPFIWWNMGDYIHIEKYIGTASEVVVPAEIEGLPVEVLGVNAFAALEHMDIVTSVELPETLRLMEYGVFIDCNNLRTINIPGSVKVVGRDCFFQCSSLSDVTIGEGVMELQTGAFRWCKSLEELALPSTLRILGDEVFWGCENLQSLTLPKNLTTMGKDIFGQTGSLKLTVHAGSVAHGYCDQYDLKYDLLGDASVTPPPAATPRPPVEENPSDRDHYRAYDMGGYMNIDRYEDIDTPPATEVNVPAWLDGVPVYEVGRNTFANKVHLEKVTLADGLLHIGGSAFIASPNLHTVVIPDSVNSIGTYAFAECYSLKHVNLPRSLPYISERTFLNCRSLEEIHIPGNVLSIEPYVFTGCWALSSVTIEEGVGEIGKFAFQDCTSLETINIPKSVTTIGEDAFANCGAVQATVYQNTAGYTYCKNNGIAYKLLDDNGNTLEEKKPAAAPYVPTWGDDTSGPTDDVPFKWNNWGDSITISKYMGVTASVTVPAYIEQQPVKTLGNGAFAGMEYVRTVKLPDTLTTIDGGAFPDVIYMTECDIPESVTEIGENAFFGSRSLKAIHIPAKVTEIKQGTFGWCASVQSVTIPGNVKLIDQQAFHDCKSLTSVEIKEGVETIGAEAFAGCNSLTSITIPASVTKMEPAVFKDCGDQVVATVYKGSTAYTYCTANGIRCKVLDKNDNVISTPTPTPTPTPDAGEGDGSGDSGEGGEDGGVTDFDLSQCNIQPSADFPFYAMKWEGNGVQLYKYDATKNSAPNRVTIPDQVDGERVITLHTGVFVGEEELKSVTLSRYMQYVGSKAFDSCPNLQNIYVYDGVFFKDDACYNCPNVTVHYPSAT